jgi:hypothetical protein
MARPAGTAQGREGRRRRPDEAGRGKGRGEGGGSGAHPVEDSIIELQVGAHGPEIRQAAKKVAELKALLREQQDAALATARQMAALYKAAAAKIPRRLVSMRSEKFLKVEIRNPVISALHHGDFASAERRRAINEHAQEAIAGTDGRCLHGVRMTEDAENKITAIRNKNVDLRRWTEPERRYPITSFLSQEHGEARQMQNCSRSGHESEGRAGL